MEHGRNRVFVNPNFNKRIINNVPDTTLRQTTVMHVNPNFCQYSQSLQQKPKTKIFINPNFVRPNEVNNHFPYVNNTSTRLPFVKPSPLMDSSNTSRVPVVPPTCHGNQTTLLCSTAPVQPFQTNSRYSLIRHKKPEEALTNVKPVTSTIKISKYKSIKVTDIKKNLDSVPPIDKIVPYQASNNNKSLLRARNNNKCPKILINHVSRYTLTRPAVCKPQFKRQTSNTPKKVVCSQTRIKAVGVYKKNNIPCPQYRKYGRCLRKSYGKCEFLHDKNHVSICRRFLNGVCHNDKCLLSHEPSDKKMPTCYFYLKGMCTKEACPYLHVKLNERAKICLDFMRGYCEKGDKCLNRHVAKNSNADQKQRRILKKLSQQKLMKYKLVKNKIRSNASSTQKRKSKIPLNQQAVLDSNESASRYYKETVQESDTSEHLEIKPSRCKLGTLPSFIQL